MLRGGSFIGERVCFIAAFMGSIGVRPGILRTDWSQAGEE